MNLIILHGWSSSPARWQKIVDLLKKDFKLKIYCPHLPGFDPKKTLSRPWNISDYSSWLQDYLNKNKIKQTVLVAHSNGGRLALNFTSQHSSKVSHLILINSAGLPPKNTLKRFIFLIPAKLGGLLFSLPLLRKLSPQFKKFLYFLAREKNYLEATPIMKETMKNMLSSDLSSVAIKIKTPTLLLWGQNDTYIPLWMGQKLNRLIKNSKLKIFATGRHGLHLTHPQKVVEFIKNFISF